jgi:hypothetical protein
MKFTEPIDFDAALDLLRAREAMPTRLGTAELRPLRAALGQRALLLARVTSARYVQAVKDTVLALLNGTINRATARLELKELLDEMGYTPEAGFPGEPSVPPAESELQNLRSDRRIELILRTETALAANRAYQIAGQTDTALHLWPAWELLRVQPREVPRGLRLERGSLVEDPGEDWPARWQAVGGTLYQGRMIAAKDDPIWDEIGSTRNFSDALDSDVPPFAFGSGYGLRQVPRAECIALGVIPPDYHIAGVPAEEQRTAQIKADFDPEFLDLVAADLDVAIEAGRARLRLDPTLSPSVAKLLGVLANARAFDESKVVRRPKGDARGGEFAPKAGGGGRAKGDRRASYKPMSRERLQQGLAEEAKVAKAVGGTNLPDNEPFDVIVGRHALEVKTIIDGTTDRIIINRSSRLRKEKFARRTKMQIHTVAIDARRQPPAYYIRDGVGAFSLSSMRRLRSLRQLKEVLG